MAESSNPGETKFEVVSNAPDRVSTFDSLDLLQGKTPARIFQSSSGLGYRTTTQLELRRDHAFALDAVHSELGGSDDLETEFRATWNLFDVRSQARSKGEYLMRPDLGRRLCDTGVAQIRDLCERQCQLQVIIGDGLSAEAVRVQVPRLLPRLHEEACRRKWTWGRPFLIHYCRVGIMNEIGELLNPDVVILLIGERPGLATSESLSAYFAYRPKFGHTDSQRNLISNIHRTGLPIEDAVPRIMGLADLLMQHAQSGISIKEQLHHPSTSNLLETTNEIIPEGHTPVSGDERHSGFSNLGELNSGIL